MGRSGTLGLEQLELGLTFGHPAYKDKTGCTPQTRDHAQSIQNTGFRIACCVRPLLRLPSTLFSWTLPSHDLALACIPQPECEGLNSFAQCASRGKVAERRNRANPIALYSRSKGYINERRELVPPLKLPTQHVHVTEKLFTLQLSDARSETVQASKPPAPSPRTGTRR
eukprot:5962916-Pleurochrysis_carterae.AAC.5